MEHDEKNRDEKERETVLEKLDLRELFSQMSLCLEEIRGLKEGLLTVRDELKGIRREWDNVKEKSESLHGISEKLESRTAAVQNSQLALRRDLNQVSTRMADTYSMALDAWGKAYELSQVYETSEYNGGKAR